MNLADAIRLAAQRAGKEPARSQTNRENPFEITDQSAIEQKKPAKAIKAEKETKPISVAARNEERGRMEWECDSPVAIDAVTEQPVRAPEPPSAHTHTGNVVRLELFLSPEQLNGLFKAFMATQHTMMTLREAAGYLRIHPSTLEKMAQDGELPALSIEGRWRFPKTNLDEWLTLQTFRSGGESHVA